MKVDVCNNDVGQALRALKRKMQREGLFREMRAREFYRKPSEKKAEDRARAIRRRRKIEARRNAER